MDRLNRIKMLMGDRAVDRLQKSTVMVVGCGAVGSFAIEALARSGVGRLILVDSDVVAESNINRQIFALDSTVGRPKVDVAAARVRDINPEIRVDAMQMFWNADSDPDIRPDFVIDAIDTIDSKIALAQWAQKRGIGFISSMGAARKTDISQIRVSSLYQTSVCPLAANMRRAARAAVLADFDVVFSTERPRPGVAPGRIFGSVVTVTGAFGLYLAGHVIRRLTDS